MSGAMNGPLTDALELRGRDVLPIAVAMSAAHEHGVLAALEARPADAATLARALGLDSRALELLLDLLLSFGLLQRSGDSFALAPILRDAGRATPGGLAADRKIWPRLREFVRDGAPVTEIDRGHQGRAPFYAGAVSALGTLWNDAAARLAGLLAGHGPSVLDVGCGSGVWSLALATARPDCVVTGLDFPMVLPSFLERAAALGLAERARAVAGDAHAIAFDGPALTGAGGGHDVVVVANVLRLEPGARAAALVARVARAVKPGGQLVIVDALAQGSAAADRDRAVYALHLGMRTRAGGVHSRAKITSWLADAGLHQTSALDLGDAPAAVAGLRAWRPA